MFEKIKKIFSKTIQVRMVYIRTIEILVIISLIATIIKWLIVE